jgi:hypothetical protein
MTFGLFLGAWAALASGLMGVSGHGWMSTAKVCWVAIFAAPLAGISWGLRRRLAGVALALQLLAVAIGADLILIWLTKAEGTGYALQAVRVSPGFMLSWAVAWFGWQVLVTWILVSAAQNRFRGG